MRILLPLFLLALVGIPSHAQSLAHSYQTNCSGSSVTTCVTTITAPTSGDVIKVSGYTKTQHLGGASNDCTTGVADNKGDAFLNIVNVQFDTVNGEYIYVCYAKNVTGGPTTVTTTLNAASTTSNEVAIEDITAVNTTTPLDQHTNNLGPGCAGACTVNASPVSSSTTTTSANEYLACDGVESSNATSWSAPTNGFSITQQLENPGHNAQIDKAVTSTTTTSCGATLSGAQFWSMAITTWVGAIQPGPNVNKAPPMQLARK